MEDSLWAGDFVLVNKFIYNFTDPKPGDIIVFKYPLNPSKDFIKRCIAIEGQTVQIIDKGLYVDGRKVGNNCDAYYDDSVGYFKKKKINRVLVLHEFYHHLAYTKGFDISEKREEKEAEEYVNKVLKGIQNK
jgi:signal peptidase I